MSQINYSKTTLRLGWVSLDDIVETLERNKERFPDVFYTVSQTSALVSIDLYGSGIENRALWEKELRGRFSRFLFTSQTESLTEAIQALCILQNKKLSLAESCTGGLLASRLVMVSGASRYFLASLVAYSEEMKHKLLGVSCATLQNYGAVSREVVEEMARGLVRVTGADVGIAISGFAGPLGGSRTAPLGTIWVSMMQGGERPESMRLFLIGSRESILEQAVDKVLFALWHNLLLGTPFSSWEEV